MAPRKKTSSAKKAAPAPAKEILTAAERPFVMTSIRLHADQLRALASVALNRRYAEPTGRKPDQSAVIRDILDAIATGERIPHDIAAALAQGVRTRAGRQ